MTLIIFIKDKKEAILIVRKTENQVEQGLPFLLQGKRTSLLGVGDRQAAGSISESAEKLSRRTPLWWRLTLATRNSSCSLSC
jgi:hypothetical protein